MKEPQERIKVVLTDVDVGNFIYYYILFVYISDTISRFCTLNPANSAL